MGILIAILISLSIMIACAVPGVRQQLRERKAGRDRALSENQQCTRCAYNLRGLPEATTRCPECGTDIIKPGGTPRRTRLHAPSVGQKL